MIEVKNVSMSFRMSQDRIQSIKEYLVALIKGKLKYKDFWALRDVSFSVHPGEVLGIIGHNGAGKSTTLKSILRFVHPDAGEITMFGENYAEHEAACKQSLGIRPWKYCAHAGVRQRI